MSGFFSLPAQMPPVSILPPAADAAGRTGGYRSLKNSLGNQIWLVCRINQGNAATVALTVLQAQDVSGTGSKPLSAATPIWLNADTSVSDAFVKQAPAPNFTTDATTKDKVVIFEINPASVMDIQNGFRTITVSTGASNAANVTEVSLYVRGANENFNAQISTYTN